MTASPIGERAAMTGEFFIKNSTPANIAAATPTLRPIVASSRTNAIR